MPSLEMPKQPDVKPAPEQSAYYAHRILESNAEAQAQIGRTIEAAGQRNADTLNRGAREIEDSADKLGASVMAQGEMYVKQAQSSLDDAAYNNAYSSASTEFAQAVQQRVNTPYDQNGTPTFGTLPQDINKLGQDIMQKHMQGLIDPAVNQRFNDNFSHLVTNHTINSMSIARKQQQDYSLSALNNIVNTSINNGLQDSRSNLDFHYAQGLGAINNAIQHGYMTKQEGDRQVDQLRSSLYKGSIQMQNSTDPAGVAKLLQSQSNDQLKIDPYERLELQKQNQSALKDQAIRERQIVHEQQQRIKENQNFNAGELQLSMMQGKAGENEIMTKYQKGDISHDQYIKLSEQYVKATQGNLKNGLAMRAISNKLQSGEMLNSFSEKQINAHYNERLKILGDKADITDKAMIASDYKAPVSAFTKELGFTAKIGNPEDIAKAAKAYEYVVQKQPLAMSQMNKQDRAFYATVNEGLQYTNKNADQVIQDAKDKIYSTKNPEEKNIYAQAFTKEKDFKSTGAGFWSNVKSPMNETILNMYEGKHLMGADDDISPEVVGHVQGLLKDAYIATKGNKGAAIKMVQDETQGIIGKSEVNSVPHLTGSRQTIMFAPPEKVYDQFTPQELRQDLNTQASRLQLPQGIQASDIQLGSDDLTQRQPHGVGADGQAETSYSMYYMKDGRQVPLLDPNTGQPLRWRPNMVEMENTKLEQARADQQSSLTNISGGADRNFKNVASTLGIGKPLYRSLTVPGKIDQSSSTISAIKAGIANTETGTEKVPYQAIGPAVHGDDHALGKYQVMESNLASWSKEALGRVVTRDEFLQSPELQEKIVGNKLGELMNQYHNVADVMSVWHSGVPLSQARTEGRHDVNMTTEEYVQRSMQAMAHDGGKDPNFMVTTAGLNGMGEHVISNSDMGNSVVDKAGDYLTQYTESKLDTQYEYGAKNSGTGKIDCSGWVGESTMHTMARINRENGNMYDMGVMHSIFNQAAAYQISSIAKVTGFLNPGDIYSGNVAPGTLIGIHYADSSATANSRPLGIAHIVQVVTKNNQLYVSQSTDGLKHAPKYGVSLMPYHEWIRTFGEGDRLYGVNPFNMISAAHMANKAHDQGTGENSAPYGFTNTPMGNEDSEMTGIRD